MNMAKNNKDPWHKGNIEKTLEKRKGDRRNLLNVIQAMDSQLIHEVTEILQKHTPQGPADWSLIDSQHKNYNKDVADLVRKKIDEVYSLDSKLHPLKDVIKKANLEKNYFNEQLVKGLYFRHTHELKKGIGEKDYMQVMKHLHKGNLDRIVKESGEYMLSDVEPDVHGEHVIDYLHDKYKFDKEKVSKDLMKTKVHELLAGHLDKTLSKDYLHRHYKKHKKAA